MKTTRRVVAVVVYLFLPSLSLAASLYDGALTRPTLEPTVPVPPAPLAAPTIPTLPEAITLPGAITALGLPTPAAITPAQIPAALQPTLSATPAARLPGARAALQGLVPREAAAPNANGGESSENSSASRASEVFDGGIVSHGIREFFGELAPSEEPGVVAAKRGASVEGAPGESEMNENVKLSPKTNREREAVAAALFEKGGAAYDRNAPATQKVDLQKYDAVQFQDAGRGKRNVVVVKKGRTDRIIVVGSHNDKVEVGDGVIDNWTGTTMVAHLYQTLKDVPTEATIVFIAHAREEEGLIGSRKFVSSLSREELKRVEANVNIDTLAIKGGGTLVWDNGDDYASAKAMLESADRAVAEENAKRPANDQLALRREPLNGGDADSSSYRDAGVKLWATFFGGSEDLIFSIIHSPRDNFGAFSLPIYRESYFVTLAVLRYLDAHGLRLPGIS